jgi:hypothetical protein
MIKIIVVFVKKTAKFVVDTAQDWCYKNNNVVIRDYAKRKTNFPGAETVD